MHLNLLLYIQNRICPILGVFCINQTIIVGLCLVISWTMAFVFVGCRYNDWPGVIVPYIPLVMYLCVSVVVSSGLQSSKGSVFPVTVLWQKHLHTVTRSDQAKQLSAGKSYRKNVYAPPEHISQTPATWIKLAATHKSVLFFLFQAYKVLPDLHLYGPKQSIEFCDSYERC